MYACGRQKALTIPAYCVAANPAVTTHKQPKAQLCTSSHGINPLWGENGSNLYNSNKLTLMLRLSHTYFCSEHFAECDFVNFMAEYQMGFASKRNLWGCPQGNRLGKNSSLNLQGWSWQAASAQHDTKNWEIHWYLETSANKAKTKSLTQMPTAKKATKERPYTNACDKERTDHKGLWHRKKEHTTNACGKERKTKPQLLVALKQKMAALIRQANSWHQMKETKQLKPHQIPKQLPTCKHKVEKTHKRTHHQITTV